VNQRNAALDWIRTNLSSGKQEGVIYFADDDNSYSVELFDEVSFTLDVLPEIKRCKYMYYLYVSISMQIIIIDALDKNGRRLASGLSRRCQS